MSAIGLFGVELVIKDTLCLTSGEKIL